MTLILDGKKAAAFYETALRTKINNCKKQTQREIKLHIIVNNDHEPSRIYVKNKIAACHKIGIATATTEITAQTTAASILTTIDELNQDETITGILVQLPVNEKLNALEIINRVASTKDVDGLTATNLGRLLQNEPNAIVSCTALGIIKLLEYYQISCDKKLVTIINDSILIGKPLAMLLNNLGATVTICHKKTPNLTQITQTADIIFSAVGIYELLTPQDVKPGCTIIDIAINNQRINQQIVGDLNFAQFLASGQVAAITPVPGGVGPMTIYALLHNLVRLFEATIVK